MIRWPRKIAGGIENDEILTAMDLLPTFAHLAGSEPPTDRVIDGKDIWPVLTDDAASPHEAFFYYRMNSMQAVRSGKRKLHFSGKKMKALYDLEADIGETTNVGKKHSDVAKRLQDLARKFKAEVSENFRPAGVAENLKPLTMP